jgi:membrane-associated protease RseP (regulator of RpoE activity)
MNISRGLGTFVCIAMLAIAAPARSWSWSCSCHAVVASDDQAQKVDVDDVIRNATGLRFRVVESVIRRNIISTRSPYGYKIRSVDADSPASRAGLKKGDVLLEWDSQPIKSRKDLAKWIDDAERGAAIAIKYARLKDRRSALDRRPWVEHEGTITLGP